MNMEFCLVSSANIYVCASMDNAPPACVQELPCHQQCSGISVVASCGVFASCLGVVYGSGAHGYSNHGGVACRCFHARCS